MVNIAIPELYNKAYSGTKVLIEEYAAQQVDAVRYVMNLEAKPRHWTGFDAQAKRDFIRGARQGLGRSTLLFEGGSIFGLCHIGVARALYRQGLLPRVITGTATGAFVAALLCIRRDDELESFLNGDDFNLEAFERRRPPRRLSLSQMFARENGYGWFQSLFRRMVRHLNEQYFQDMMVLQECARAELGTLTFEEAYARTLRVLNITLAMPKRGGAPNLLNYITAPHVIIWTACIASNKSFTAKGPVRMMCKDETGQIVLWEPLLEDLDLHSWHLSRCRRKASPLRILPQVLNVNHFIISQARPFLTPIFRSQIHRPGHDVPTGEWEIFQFFKTLAKVDMRHHLREYDSLRGLPNILRRILIKEDIPGSCVALLSDVSFWDLIKVFRKPTKESIRSWILRGERGVWPSIASLKVRCLLEMELEHSYAQLTKTWDTNLLTW
ncbi:predicted protein [Uncinocarpus reesii 1704]|uniref:PNPLA domain-containing protein n=1 Tax=Uncinocarpus reesii (strain UAMH 1704) TaxID=336963 RepID=C4JTE6_UNCRE|nr:uncharacterized protein UREG_05735 [Uncinocarpus reesii 1704]EEP80893.1 predicted protein [Uncinocarpus reesii 1704]